MQMMVFTTFQISYIKRLIHKCLFINSVELAPEVDWVDWCGNAGAVGVWCAKEGAKPEGETLSFPVNLPLSPHR